MCPRNGGCCHRVLVYCNNYMLQRNGICHERAIVGISYHHKCLLPQADNRHGFGDCCSKLWLRTKLWHQACNATEKNAATCHTVVAIASFLATIFFPWQQPITIGHFATLGNECHVVAIGTYCHDSTLIATNTVVAIDPISCSDT